MNAYQKGSAFERTVKKDLEARGYVVAKTGGSRSPFDLLAVRSHATPLVVQAKTNGRIDPHEREALIEVAKQAGAFALMAEKPLKYWVVLADRGRGAGFVP